MPSQLQAGLPFASQILVGHPFNPPDLMPLVEVVPGEQTAPETVERAMAFYEGLGKRAVRLRRERPGHLANRLQAALWREAVDAVASGAATAADVDAAVTAALGPRWAVMGPFASLHVGGGEGGLAHFLDHIGPAFEALWADAKTPVMDDALKARLVRETAEAVGDRPIAELAAERDERLKAVLAARGF
jgi:3-hydroxyacyl-CoA dehydrogenase